MSQRSYAPPSRCRRGDPMREHLRRGDLNCRGSSRHHSRRSRRRGPIIRSDGTPERTTSTSTTRAGYLAVKASPAAARFPTASSRHRVRRLDVVALRLRRSYDRSSPARAARMCRDERDSEVARVDVRASVTATGQREVPVRAAETSVQTSMRRRGTGPRAASTRVREDRLVAVRLVARRTHALDQCESRRPRAPTVP